MVWFRSDDNLLDHPKWIGLPDASKVLWHEVGMWCSRHLTNGFVPSAYLASRGSDLDATIRALVRSGLWERVVGGYQYHDWADWNPSKEKVEAERKATAERQARFRESRRNGVRNATSNAVTNASPARPDPPPKGGEGWRPPASQGGASAARSSPARRCPTCGNTLDHPYHLGPCQRSQESA